MGQHQRLRGTTYVQPPTRFRFALQQAQHAILRAIVHNNPTSPASESAWKALVLSSWRNCAHFLDARLELFWAEDWSALWAMVRPECDVATVQNTMRRTDKQQTQSRVRKVATDQPLDRRHLFCQSPPSILGAHVAPLPPPGLEQPTPPPRLRLSRSRSLLPAALIALLCNRLQVPPTWEHTCTPCRCQEECKYRARGNPQLY